MAFCPSCGKEAVDTFCSECLRSQEPLLTNIKPISFTKCDLCDRILWRGVWQNPTGWDKFVGSHLVFNTRATILRAEWPVPVIEPGAKEFLLPILVEGTVSQHIEPYTEEYEARVSVTAEQCDRCSLAKSQYFEGVLQIRNPHEEIVEFIEYEVQREPEVFITKTKEVRGGIDFYFTDQKYLVHFVHQLHKAFGGEVKIQSRLHTRSHETSKELRRLTALLRLPNFWVGDVIETEKRLFLIYFMGSTLKGFDLRRGKKSSTSCPDEAEVLEVHEAVLSSVQPEVTILDPDDYQEVPVIAPEDVVPGSTVRFVVDSTGKRYVLPK